MATAVALGVLVSLNMPAMAQSYRHIETQRNFSRADFVLEAADLNGDGRDDIVVGGRASYPEDGRPEHRFRKTAVRVLFGTGSGRFRPAPGRFVQGTIRARWPIVVAADFNNDRRLDLAVFDQGVYVPELSVGVGNPPQLYLSRGRRLYRSSALADAVRREHRQNPNPDYSGPGDLHIKTVTTGDIDNDGDIDLWVESTGGANVASHFMVNNGDGSFAVDTARAPYELLHNPWPEYWRHYVGHLVDLDNDGDLDLALGQMRDDDHTHINQSSIVLVNDGTGHFPERIALPHPRFYRGLTEVVSIIDFDMNGDGRQDLLFSHTRNDLSTDDETGTLAFTGRYIQALINRGDLSFGDQTDTRVKGQTPTRRQRFPNGDGLYNTVGALVMRDLNRDGCADLLMSETIVPITRQSPIAYRNNGRGQFRPLAPEPFTEAADDPRYFGSYATVADVNGDELPDFVVPKLYYGPDGRRDTRDDFTKFTTLLNATRPRPVRCE